MDIGTEGFAITRFIIGGLLAWLAVSVAFGPELLRTLVRLRVDRTAEAPASTPGVQTTAPDA
jgi:hypothetical protein